MGRRCLQSRPRGPAPKSAQPGRAGSIGRRRATEVRHHTLRLFIRSGELGGRLRRAMVDNSGTTPKNLSCSSAKARATRPLLHSPGPKPGREVASCARAQPAMAQCGKYPNSDPVDTLPRPENRSWPRGGSGRYPSAVPRRLLRAPPLHGRFLLQASAAHDRRRSQELRGRSNDSDGSRTRRCAIAAAIHCDEIPPPCAKPAVRVVLQPHSDKSKPADRDCWASTR